MKTKYVKTSNHLAFIAGVRRVQSGAAKEARIIQLAGEPGTGKSACVDFYGSAENAVHIEGLPRMTVPYIRDLLAYEMGVVGSKGFALQKSIQEAFMTTRQTIILDEAQHGLENKAEVIDYLRRITEQAGSMLVLVCHSSERHRFGEHKLAHIATRISSVVEFNPATLDDCALYLAELCEIEVDGGIVQQVHSQSRGRYRLMTAACWALEMIAKAKRLDQLTAADVRGMMLCEDAMKSLKKDRV